MKTMDEARAALIQAREAYNNDLQWLRTRYGIIPEPEPHLVKGVLLAALGALEKNDLPSMIQAIQSFDTLHKDTLARIAWDLLEQTKRHLKALRASDPALHEEKLQLWKQASWAFTRARFLLDTAKYREAIRLITRV
jgi:hypothetical protein